MTYSANFFYEREYMYTPHFSQGEAEDIEAPTPPSGKLAIFPNPSRTWADVRYTLPEKQTEGTLLITAVNGRVVQEVNLSRINGHIELNTEHWIPGVYFISLITNGHLQHKTTLIVRR